ncbi:MAG TPA: hypothetical protein VFU16_03385 [Solirubrobacterales bacterium]|nr:hypothetical protein [Solirubrobacterales bacterium]
MKARIWALTAAIAAIAAIFAASASAAPLELEGLDLSFREADGSPGMAAGSHPYEVVTENAVKTTIDPKTGKVVPVADIKDLNVALPPGFTGNPTATIRCTTSQFLESSDLSGRPKCPDSSAVGIVKVTFGEPGAGGQFPVYNLVPPPGQAAKLAFNVLGRAPVWIDLKVNPEPPYNVLAEVSSISQAVNYYDSVVRIWGVPAASSHDGDRGFCAYFDGPANCPVNVPLQPFVTMPTSCTGPLPVGFRADSWLQPGLWLEETVFTHDGLLPPSPLGVGDCTKLGFAPGITARPTTKAATSPSGLDFSLDVDDDGLTSATGKADSTIRKAVVTLPEGMTVNPSIAEGLEVCTQAQLAAETAFSVPGAGCPEASKIGTVEVETPLLDENVNGALYIAKPYENSFGSLIAAYIVIKNPTLGIVIKQGLKIEPDPVTGQLTTTADGLPQLPFAHFKLHFREGARSPLASPQGCGTYSAEAKLTPWSGGPVRTTTSAFSIIVGPESGPCPAGGVPPLRPDLVAGTINNAGGRFSPFYVRLSRKDSEQEITHFSIKLPPGVSGKLAGIPYCPDAAIAAAKARTGPNGGAEELASPSCPAASEIGRTLVGAGVGGSLAYAPGKLYLAGPYNGSPLSLVAITAGVVGPFDIGTVVVREAFQINPRTAEVFIDATGSDPIPHIIKGVPVHLRDIRVYADRPEFVLNPSNCKRTSTASTLLGAGLDFGSAADDRPFTVSTPFQAADCGALSFKPRLKLKLKGGTKRGGHPRLIAKLAMNGFGEAGIAKAQVTLPHSAFLDQGHIKTICTRVQFNAGAGHGTQCPARSVYGFARATTPILAEPLVGPVYLRSSENPLPDLVAALGNSQVKVELVGRIDSVKGQIRNTFESTPDAPISSFTLEMQGGKKGLLVNSTNICRGTHRAIAAFDGQNGKRHTFRPPLKADCGKKGKRSQ